MVRDAGTEFRAGPCGTDVRALGGVPPVTRMLFVWAAGATPFAGGGAEFAAAA